jgi:DNA primase
VRQFAPEDLLNTKLFKENGCGTIDFFANRITFPIIYKNEVAHITSRALPGYDAVCKYLHQHGPISLSINHDCIENATTVFIVEGPFDCMSLVQEGFDAIGVLGAGRISHKIIEDLYNKTVVIVPDYDPNQAGQKGALRIAKKLMEYNIPSYIIQWPKSAEKIDVNNFLYNHTVEELREVFRSWRYFDEPQIKKPPKYTSAKDLPSIMKAAGRYLGGRQIGSNYVARCLWHEEKTGSLVVYEKSQTFYCFGCGRTGSVLDIIVKGEELNGNRINYVVAKEIAKTL